MAWKQRISSTLKGLLKSQEVDYGIALDEMKNGHKRSHWIWYIFPQLRGLGSSAYSYVYGLADVEEAKAYLNHPLLGKRLREITSALLSHKDKSAETLMGSSVDAIKLRSSMTLFGKAQPDDVFSEVLSVFFNGERDVQGLNMLEHRSYGN